MSTFGGTIKLTGADGYKRALNDITSALKKTGQALKSQTDAFSKSESGAKKSEAAQAKLANAIKKEESALNSAKGSWSNYATALEAQKARHSQLSAEFKKAVKDLENIKKESGETSAAYKKQEAVVNELGQKLADSSREMNDTKSAMSGLKSEIKAGESDIKSAKNAMNDLGDSAEKSGDKAERAKEGFTVFKGVLANLVTDGIHAAINGCRRLGEAAINVGKQAYESYSNYEQLVGGVDTLFGKASKTVQNYAQNAYKTAGISANQYMEQVTSFSATLLQGLHGDTAKAAKVSNQAIIDMSDNANKMGTNMNEIQRAYQGFAKDNYTMLDNLKLGYGGTQSEMARLINDSGVLGDSVKVTAKTVKDVPFDKVIEAIHKIQQKLKITGTTSKEAATTLEGSANSMKASWQNLLTGIASGDQDVGKLVNQFVHTVTTALSNSAPRIREVIKGMGKLVEAVWNDVLPELKVEVPELRPVITGLQIIHDLLPAIGASIAAIAAYKITTAMITGITGAVEAFKMLSAVTKGSAEAQMLLNGAMAVNPIGLVVAAIAALVAGFAILWNTSESFRNFWIGLWNGIKTVVSTAVTGIVHFFTQSIPNGLKTMVTFFHNLPANIAGALTSTITKISKFASDMIKHGKSAGTNFVNNVVNFTKNLPYKIGYVLGTVIGNVASWAVKFVNHAKNAGKNFVTGAVNYIKNLPSRVASFLTQTISRVSSWASSMVSKAKSAGSRFVSSVANYISRLPSRVGSYLTQTISRAASFVSQMAQKGVQAAQRFGNAIVNGLRSIPSKMGSIGRDIVRGIWSGISGAAGWLASQIKSFASGIVNGFKNAFKIHSPSKVMEDEVGVNIAKGIVSGIKKENKNSVKEIQVEMRKSINKLNQKRRELLAAVNKAHTKTQKAAAVKRVKEINQKIKDEQEKWDKKILAEREKYDKQLVSRAKTRANELKKAGKLSALAEISYWDAIAKACHKGTDSYKTATAKAAEMRKSLGSELDKLTKTYEDGITKASQELDDKIKELNDAYNNAVKQRQDEITSSLSLFDVPSLNKKISKEWLTLNLKDQVTALDEWNQTLNSLEKRLGSENPLYKELTKAGVANLDTLKSINEMSDSELAYYNQLYDQKQTIALQRSVEENAALKRQTDADIAQAKADTEKKIRELQKDYTDGLKKLGVKLNKEAGSVGKNMAKGLGTGFSSEMQKVKAQLIAEADAMVAAIKKRMKIKSPSQVMRDEVGKMLAAGIGVGFTTEMESVTAQMQNAIPTRFDINPSVNSGLDNKYESDKINIISQLKEALSDMRVEMDGDEMGRFVDKTVTRLVFN